MPADKRSVDRDACFIEAQIVVAEDEPSFTCVVTDISEDGAKIEIDPAAQLPPYFTLALPVMPNVSHSRCVEMRWRRGNEVGLRFVSARLRSASRLKLTA